MTIVYLTEILAWKLEFLVQLVRLALKTNLLALRDEPVVGTCLPFCVDNASLDKSQITRDITPQRSRILKPYKTGKNFIIRLLFVSGLAGAPRKEIRKSSCADYHP